MATDGSANFVKAKKGLGKAIGGISEFSRSTSARLLEQGEELKGAALDVAEKAIDQGNDLRSAVFNKVGQRLDRDSITTELDREDQVASSQPNAETYEEAVAEYNIAFSDMSENGLSLLRQRERTIDLIELVELLVNSIANTPKSFAADFEMIRMQKATFRDSQDFAYQDLAAARASAVGAGVGLATGTSVALMAPTAAMWVATTFGTASTGTAISALSGAAATKASLAWLGGGALAAGGSGIVGGNALLALAGPIGWTVAGATLLTSIVLYTKKKNDNKEAQLEALNAVKKNTLAVSLMDAHISGLLQRSSSARELLRKYFEEAMGLFGAEYSNLLRPQQQRLAMLVNSALAAAALLSELVDPDDQE